MILSICQVSNLNNQIKKSLQSNKLFDSVEEIDAESKAITDAADETKTEEKIQQGLQSKRTRILAFGKGLKEMAKEKVKEKIEPVMKNRRMRNEPQVITAIE